MRAFRMTVMVTDVAQSVATWYTECRLMEKIAKVMKSRKKIIFSFDYLSQFYCQLVVTNFTRFKFFLCLIKCERWPLLGTTLSAVFRVMTLGNEIQWLSAGNLTISFLNFNHVLQSNAWQYKSVHVAYISAANLARHSIEILGWIVVQSHVRKWQSHDYISLSMSTFNST